MISVNFARASEEKQVSDEHDCTPLHRAVLEGNIDLIERLISKHHSTTVRDKKGNTPIQLAIDQDKGPNWEAVIAIARAAKSVPGDGYNWVLLKAVEANQAEAALALLEAGTGTELCGSDGNRPLHCAVKNENIALIKALILRGASTTAENKEGNTPIQLANHFEKEKLEAVSEAIKASEKHFNKKCKDLLSAAQDHKTDDALDLLEAGAGTTFFAGKGQYSHALLSAVMMQNGQLIKALILRGASGTAPDSRGYQPIKFAGIPMQKLMLNEENTFLDVLGAALLEAAKHNRTEEALDLLNNRARTNKHDGKNMYTALHWAVHHNNTELFKALFEKKASILAKNIDDKTPIDLLIEKQNFLALTLKHIEAIQRYYKYDPKEICNYIKHMVLGEINTLAEEKPDAALAKLREILCPENDLYKFLNKPSRMFTVHFGDKTGTILKLKTLEEKLVNQLSRQHATGSKPNYNEQSHGQNPSIFFRNSPGALEVVAEHGHSRAGGKPSK